MGAPFSFWVFRVPCLCFLALRVQAASLGYHLCRRFTILFTALDIQPRRRGLGLLIEQPAGFAVPAQEGMKLGPLPAPPAQVGFPLARVAFAPRSWDSPQARRTETMEKRVFHLLCGRAVLSSCPVSSVPTLLILSLFKTFCPLTPPLAATSSSPWLCFSV